MSLFRLGFSGAKMANLLPKGNFTSRRGIAIITCNQTPDYQDPWECPRPGGFVTHLDATSDLRTNAGGAVALVTRDEHGNVVDSGTKWFPGVVNTAQLEFHGLIYYTSKEAISKNITICTDSNVVLTALWGFKGEKSLQKNKEMPELAKAAMSNLKQNFPSNVRVMWVPSEANGIADELSR